MALASGERLGPYEIVAPLGAGGMGEVWRARDTRLERDVAIKALPAHLATDPDRLSRFQREAKMLASLNHPNIGAIYGLEEVDGHRYLILEYVEGETLAAHLKRSPLPVDEALSIAVQIAQAFEAAHEKGIIHRDLKPGNIMLTAEGKVKVLDFGLARTADGLPGSTHLPASPDSPTATSPAIVHSPTIPGAIMGTAGYMSPEQARGKTVDKRSDIFSFGCVLYEMFAGAQPFQGETVADSLGAILHREPDWTRIPHATPPLVCELLTNCLAKDRKHRLCDIGDARLELERVIAGNVWTSAADEDLPRRTRLLGPLGILAAIILIALGVALRSAFYSRTGGGELACVAMVMPPDFEVRRAEMAPDGRTMAVMGKTREPDSSGVERRLIYVRHLDGYQFKPLAGTEGVLQMWISRDSSRVLFDAPVAPGAPQRRLAVIPLDGSAPATTIADWKDSWRSIVELASGDLLILDGEASYVTLPKTGGAPSTPVKLDAGRPGVHQFEFTNELLPGDRFALVNVVSYDARGWHFSIGALDPGDGKVKIIVDDGGNAVYSPTGHLLFARAEVILAAAFEPQRVELCGAPVAVWSGLCTPSQPVPGTFELTHQGALFYRPGQASGDRSLAFLGVDGKLEPWSSERRAVDSDLMLSPDGSRFVCAITNARGINELWVSPVDHANFVKLGSDPNADCIFPIWSPDGGRIAYYRRGKDARDGVYIQNVDGGETRRVLKPGSDENLYYILTGWLPDGSALLMNRETPREFSVVLLPLGELEVDDRNARPLLPVNVARFAKPSADGRLLAFGNEETGKSQIWVGEMRPSSGIGKAVQVKTSVSVCHAWAADGKTLFIEDERHQLLKATVTIGPPLSVSAPVNVADLEKLGIQKWSLLPDGRFFVSLRNESEGEITRYDLVLNWTQLLSKKLPEASK